MTAPISSYTAEAEYTHHRAQTRRQGFADEERAWNTQISVVHQIVKNMDGIKGSPVPVSTGTPPTAFELELLFLVLMSLTATMGRSVLKDERMKKRIHAVFTTNISISFSFDLCRRRR